ncbi:tetratricopeptide repeat protein [Chitinimonas sp. BJYL2]|uniref:tetratricopeptide repeat protein n=1 Tax=Chitinimonas sp. BJYL2 TaxID=2976696 RepID=UPI0022B48C3E|nr:tetratricopeptide repeat protein [Chitinimonas sp. BJYL2]
MSLLLDALKKAEEAKRRREAGLTTAPAASAAVPGQPDAGQAALPELSLQDAIEPAAPVAPTASPAADGLTFTLEPVAPHTEDLALTSGAPEEAALPALEMAGPDEMEATPTPTAKEIPALMDVEPAAEMTVAAQPEPKAQPATEPVAEIAKAAPPAAVSTAREPDPVAAPPSASSTTPTSPPASPAATIALETRRDSPMQLSPEATRQLFDSKRTQSQGLSRGRRVALLIGLCFALVFAGGGWLWWLWQGTQQGSLALVPTRQTSASDAAPLTEAAVAEAVSNALPAPTDSAGSVAPAPSTPVTASTPAPAADTTQAPPQPAPPVKPRDGDRARVIEVPHDVAAPDVRFVRDAQDNAIPRNLQLAYDAFQQGDYPRAAELYRQHLRQDSKSRDALLGLAAVAVQRQQLDEARNLYRRVLADNPRDELANAALISLSTNNDPDAAEGKLRTQMQQSPRPETATALANLLARQGRWSEAQEFYFQAHGAAPDDPDYAYNLAIALDALGERKLAADYYRKALNMAARKPASFDADAAQRRLAKLGGE